MTDELKKKLTLTQHLIAAPHIVWTVIFIIVPLLMILWYAFTDADNNFTLSNIQQLSSGNYPEIFFRSISFALIATVICLIIGYPLAYFITQTSPKVQKTLILLTMLPMWTNLLVRTYSWMTLLEDGGIINTMLEKIGIPTLQMINTPFAVILGMVYNFLPFMVFPIFSVMTKLDKNLIEAAQDLGCNRIAVLTKVIIPLTVSGIVSGITMVFVPSISTFYISQKLGGGKFDLIGDTIERQFKINYDYHLGAALSLVLMILIFISLAVMNKFSGEDDGGMVL